MSNLTPRQLELLKFIRFYRGERGVMPSYLEMGQGIGVKSRGRVAHIMQDLEERGAIKKNSRRSRDFSIIEETGVTLSPEICRLVDQYAQEQNIQRETATNELLRQVLGAAA
jgi:SOS-response transcriptional repressor LexA